MRMNDGQEKALVERENEAKDGFGHKVNLFAEHWKSVVSAHYQLRSTCKFDLTRIYSSFSKRKAAKLSKNENGNENFRDCMRALRKRWDK